ncbi:MAG: glycogen debranching protein GlgX [Alphaproteobacteria bacterium]|nr:glycogen debranching protein GlgX [Alphaproteobacteria bacterium]
MLADKNISLGSHFDGYGTHFSIFSANAEHIEVCLFSEDGLSETKRISLKNNEDNIWHVYIDAIGPGTLYGYRVHGSFLPEKGLWFNPNKLLIDPYARLLSGPIYVHESHFCNTDSWSLDSAPFTPKCIVVDEKNSDEDSACVNVPWSKTVIYEIHVKGITQTHPGIPVSWRGKFNALVSDEMINHFKALGVTTLELLPIQSFSHDKHLTDKGLSNYWGYNPINFFAPHSDYLVNNDLGEMKKIIQKLHQEGFEIILDVVFNHTGEGNQQGPMLCYRGIDNLSYYHLSDSKADYVDYTGCGNSLNLTNPCVLQLVMDSLRYWFLHVGVDGFRFDLGVELFRSHNGYESVGHLYYCIMQDPALQQAKLIAEPWDTGHDGYKLGKFPQGWSEWNDYFRDTVRRFWRGEESLTNDLATVILGSAPIFDKDKRKPSASINFVTAHDGFTLEDLVSYTFKYNRENLENNGDGSDSNFSFNHGFEGKTDNPRILAERIKTKKNILATLLLSRGVPMILSGDELHNSQGGNNNTYCQDNKIGWVNWDSGDTEWCLPLITQLHKIREQIYRTDSFLQGAIINKESKLKDISWYTKNGIEKTHDDWGEQEGLLCFMLACGVKNSNKGTDLFFFIINGSFRNQDVIFPRCSSVALENSTGWEKILDTSINPDCSIDCLSGKPISVESRSFSIFHKNIPISNVV